MACAIPPQHTPVNISRTQDKVRVPIPLPPSIRCGHESCRGKRGSGPWSGEDRKKHLLEHLKIQHPGRGALTPVYFCTKCPLEFNNFITAGRHGRKCSGEANSISLSLDLTLRSLEGRSTTTSDRRSSVRRAFPVSEISSNKLILLYPGVPSQCPRCGWVTLASNCNAMHSMARHLETKHALRLEKFWKCSKCGAIEQGKKMHAHDVKCRPLSPSPPASSRNPEALTISSTPSPSPHSDVNTSEHSSPLQATPPSSHQEEDRDSEDAPNESWLFTLPRQDASDASRAENSEMTVISFASPTTTSDSPAAEPSPLEQPIFSESTSSTSTEEIAQQETPTPDVSQRSNSAEEDELVPPSEHPSRRPGHFFHLWGNLFSGCKNMEELNDVLGRCTIDWLARASTTEQPLQEHRPRPETPPLRPRRRNQSRQLQRIRQRKRSSPEEASRIQRLFNVYPRRAVRQVLGEKSSPYTGSTEAANQYLHRTYVRPLPSLDECTRARRLFDACNWTNPTESQSSLLNRPPSREEIEIKLRRATNTSPGADGIEYRHIKSLDPQCRLLEIIYQKVWQIGIPDAWRRSRTVPIFKKGDPSDFSNFRPISLLSTLYKIYSGILSQRITAVAVELGWLSPGQKGFLPGVHGIQEHTQLLQTAVEETTSKHKSMSMAWLDLCNAFGSVPHAVLFELFDSLPLPNDLKRMLSDIYTGNIMDFVVGNESVSIAPTAGVRQGDALSTTVFNLAAKPLLRAALSESNPGIDLFGHTVKATSYADDISVMSNTPQSLQETLHHLSRVASILGLKFNAGKCASLNFNNGKPFQVDLFVDGSPIRCLGPEDQEIYLGTPIGAKLRFRPPNQLVSNLDKIAGSLLAPWQKLEVFRSHLLPSLSHHLASGRVLKDVLTSLDTECRKFLGHVTMVPNSATSPFFYADRRVGGLGTFSLSDDADIWTLARAVQLLTSKDRLVKDIFMEQLKDTILRGFREEVPATLPIGEYLSGSTEAGLYRLRFGPAGTNLWTLARGAAKRLRARIDVSGDENFRIIADDVSVLPAKAVRGLRQVVRQRHTRKFISAPHQGRVASALAIDQSTKDIARLTSCRTDLQHNDWKYLHRARLDLLPLRGYSWSSFDNKSCRHCGESSENGLHVLNNCKVNLTLATQRHDAVLELFHHLLSRKGYAATINRRLPETRLRPEVELQVSGSRLMINVAVSYDLQENLEAAYTRKVVKYQHLGQVLPLVLGSLGSWHPLNDDIRSLLAIDHRSWSAFRRKSRLAAIHGSMEMVKKHLTNTTDEHITDDP